MPHTNPITILRRRDRCMLDRVQGAKTIQGDYFVAIIQAWCDSDLSAVSLWPSPRRGYTKTSKALVQRIRSHFVVKLHCGLDEIDVFTNVGGDGIGMATYEIYVLGSARMRMRDKTKSALPI